MRGILDKEEVLLAKNAGSLRHVHVVIGTPDAMVEAASDPQAAPVLRAVKALAVDEADACLQVPVPACMRITSHFSDRHADLSLP